MHLLHVYVLKLLSLHFGFLGKFFFVEERWATLCPYVFWT